MEKIIYIYTQTHLSTFFDIYTYMSKKFEDQNINCFFSAKPKKTFNKEKKWRFGGGETSSNSKQNFCAAVVPLVGLWRHPVDKGYSLAFCFVFVFTGVALMPSVVYLCITLFTELFNLAGSDVAILVAVPTLEQRQATADPTLPGSCTTKRNTFNGGEFRAGVEARRNTTVLSSESSCAGNSGISWLNVTQLWLSHTHLMHLHNGRNDWLRLTVFKEVCDVQL